MHILVFETLKTAVSYFNITANVTCVTFSTFSPFLKSACISETKTLMKDSAFRNADGNSTEQFITAILLTSSQHLGITVCLLMNV